MALRYSSLVLNNPPDSSFRGDKAEEVSYLAVLELRKHCTESRHHIYKSCTFKSCQQTVSPRAGRRRERRREMSVPLCSPPPPWPLLAGAVELVLGLDVLQVLVHSSVQLIDIFRQLHQGLFVVADVSLDICQCNGRNGKVTSLESRHTLEASKKKTTSKWYILSWKRLTCSKQCHNFTMQRQCMSPISRVR